MLVFLTSCSLFSTQKLSTDLSQNLNAWCLNGSGKGRIEFGSERHVFDYYDKTEKSDHYLVALDLPLYGEETLILFFKQEKFDGTFLKRMKKSGDSKKFLSLWRKLIIAKQNSQYGEEFQFKQHEDSIEINAALSEKQSVTLTLFQLNNDGYFARQTLNFVDNLTKQSLKIELFTKECRNLATH